MNQIYFKGIVCSIFCLKIILTRGNCLTKALMDLNIS